jgi:hypothetical protein
MSSVSRGVDLGSALPDPSAALLAELERLQHDRGRVSRAVAARALRFREWAELVPEQRGPLDFGRFRYQAELFEPWMVSDDDACFMKATQCGISALAIRFALYVADVMGGVAIYCFPSDRTLRDFSRQRIRPIIRNSPHLLDRIPPGSVDNVDQRQIGTTGWLYCRGTMSPVLSTDADAIVFDELDSADQQNVEISERRVSGPQSAGLIRRVGVPSVPGYGISAAFEASDQRVWTVKCSACGERNPMRGAEAFAANVDQERELIVCRKCRRRLDVQGAGEWVATFPDRTTRGYALPKLIVPGVKLDKLIANSKKTRPDQRESFMQSDLGEPYAAAENRLGLEELRACVDPDARLLPSLQSDRFVAMGVDVADARALSVVIGELLPDGRSRRVFVGEVDDRDGRTASQQLSNLMRRYGVHMAVIDHLPSGRFSEAFANEFPGRVWRAGFYDPHPTQRQESAPWTPDDAVSFVGLWRTRWIDLTLERFRVGDVVLPPLETLPAIYPAQLGALVRTTEELPSGLGVRVRYVSTGADDLGMAEVYLTAAFALLWRRVGMVQRAELEATPVPLLEPGDMFGLEPVYRPGFDDDEPTIGWSPDEWLFLP